MPLTLRFVVYRPTVLSVIIRLLFPKLRKRSGRLAGRGAPGSARSAILNKLASLEAPELTPLLELFLEPLARIFRRDAEASAIAAAQDSGTPYVEDVAALGLQSHWWAKHLANGNAVFWLAVVDAEALAHQPLRRRQGLLNTISDLFNHLGFRMQPFLPVLTTLVVLLLRDAAAAISLSPGTVTSHICYVLRSRPVIVSE